jgi:hypothetical protein
LKVLHTNVLGSAGLRMVFKLRCDVFHHLQRLSLGSTGRRRLETRFTG